MIALHRSSSPRRLAPRLYASVVAAARAPAFYRDLGVADTIEGRYEMIVLHIVLVLRRLRMPDGQRPKLAQALIDYMAADFDRSMRELGIGDLSVARFMKRLGEGLYGRAAAYDAALDAADLAALHVALLRNVYNGVDPDGVGLATIAHYVLAQSDYIGSQPIDRIDAGEVDFLPPDGVPTT